MLKALSSIFGSRYSVGFTEDDYAPNRFFNHFQIHDMPEGVSQVRVIDEERVAVAVEGYLLLLDIKFGQICQTLEVHKSGIKLMEIFALPLGPFICTVDKSNLIVITSISSSNELKSEKCLLLQANADITNISVVRSVGNILTPHDVGFVCGSKRLHLVSYTESVVCTDVGDRFTATEVDRSKISEEETVVVLDSRLYLIRVTPNRAESICKCFEQRNTMKLRLSSWHSPPQLPEDDRFTCATLLSDDRYAVASRDGCVFWFPIESGRRSPRGFLSLSLPSRNRLDEMDKIDESRLVIMATSLILIIDTHTKTTVCRLPFPNKLLSISVYRGDMLLTLLTQKVSNDGESSAQVVTWNIPDLIKGKSAAGTKQKQQQHPCSGAVRIHDGTVEGMLAYEGGLITYGTDNMLIVARNNEILAEKRIADLKLLANELEEDF